MFLDDTEDDRNRENEERPDAASSDGHGAAPDFDEHFTRVYSQLRGVARGLMAQEAAHTLTPTGLVHELWVKLRDNVEYRDRPSFLILSSKAMARILIDHSRRKLAAKKHHTVEHSDVHLVADVSPEAERLFAGRALDLAALGDALTELEKKDSRTSDVVYLYFFLGLSFAQCGETLGISESSARRGWKFARNWLRMNM